EQLGKLRREMSAAAQHRDEATASVAQLSKSLSYTQKELTDTKSALARLAEDPSGPAAMSERVKAMMQLAEEEIGDHKDKAEKDAAATRDAADAYSDKTRQKAEAVAVQLADEAKAERDRLDKEAADRRAAAERKSADAIAAAERQSAESITATEQKSAKAISAKRAAAEKAVAELHADVKQRTDAMTADAETRLADATKQQKAAVEFRKTVADRLTASHSALQEAIEQLGALPEANAKGANAGANAKQPA
ncbi:MAG: cell division protein DivIVA, partial [Thermocrispum sp.]